MEIMKKYYYCQHDQTKIIIDILSLKDILYIECILFIGNEFTVKLMPKLEIFESNDKTHIWRHKRNGHDVFETILTVPFLVKIKPEDVDKRCKNILPFI